MRRRNFLYLLLREDYTQWTDYKEEGEYPNERKLEKRVVLVLLHKETPWSSGALNGFDAATIGSCVRPEEKVIVARSTVWFMGPGAAPAAWNQRFRGPKTRVVQEWSV